MAVLALIVHYLIMPLTHSNTGYVLPKKSVPAQKVNEPSEPGEETTAADHVIIADQNLFHPERIIPVEKPEVKPLPKPEFVLYGTTLIDERSIAYIEDKKVPQSTPGRGKRVSILKKGDSLSGFVLTDIERESVTMVRGNEKIIVYLNELKSRAHEGPPEQLLPPHRTAGPEQSLISIQP